MMDWLRNPRLRWLRSMWFAVGLGMVAGCFEAVQIVAMLRLDLSLAQGAVLTLCCAAAGAVVGLPAGLVAGLFVQVAARNQLDSKAYAMAMGLTGFLLSGFYLWQATANMVAMERGVAAVLAMAVCPVGVSGVIWLNAGYWLRREEVGAEVRVGWNSFALLTTLVFALGCGLVAQGRVFGGRAALEGDPNVLIITVDTLRRDHVSLFEADSPASTPNIDGLAEGGSSLVFLDAVTPTPETAPAHASLFTSLHPLRHEVLSNADSLATGHTTLAEVLEDEGYATGAFVSSFAVHRRSGLDQGFEVYDDDFAPVRGLSQVLLVRHLARLALASGQGHRMEWLLERDGGDTVGLASSWIEARGEQPWMAWVHLFEPHAPYEGEGASVDHRALLSDPDHVYTDEEAHELRRLYALEVEQADALVGELMASIPDNTIVVFTSDHGEQLGEHDIFFRHHGLFDEVVRVPLILRLPELKGQVETLIPAQVRLMDVAPTVLRAIRLDPLEPTEGVELLGYGLRTRQKSLICDLFGRKGPSLSEGCLAGLRSDSKQKEGEEGPPGELRVKYITDGQVEQFYNLVEDPSELDDISGQQQGAVEACRDRVAPSLDRCGGEGEDWTVGALKSLGYL